MSSAEGQVKNVSIEGAESVASLETFYGDNLRSHPAEEPS